MCRSIDGKYCLNLQTCQRLVRRKKILENRLKQLTVRKVHANMQTVIWLEFDIL